MRIAVSAEPVEVRLPSGAVLRVPEAMAARIQAAARPAPRHDPERCRGCGHYLSDREQRRRLLPHYCDDCRMAAMSSDLA